MATLTLAVAGSRCSGSIAWLKSVWPNASHPVNVSLQVTPSGVGRSAHQRAFRAATARSRANLPIRPAIAAMVKLGLGPTGPGMIDPSATNRPG